MTSSEFTATAMRVRDELHELVLKALSEGTAPEQVTEQLDEALDKLASLRQYLYA